MERHGTPACAKARLLGAEKGTVFRCRVRRKGPVKSGPVSVNSTHSGLMVVGLNY